MNIPIITNGTTQINFKSLKLGYGTFTFFIAGVFGGGTVSIRWNNGVDSSVQYAGGSFTSAGLLTVPVGTPFVDVVVSGATDPVLTLTVSEMP